MSRLLGVVFVILTLVWDQGGVTAPCVDAHTLTEHLHQQLRHRFEATATPTAFTAQDRPLYAPVMLTQVYQQRIFQPVWSDDKGPLVQVNTFLHTLREADREGLRPAEYHLGALEALLADIRRQQAAGVALDPGRLADFDILLTDAFLTYGMHLLQGRVNPQTLRAEWHIAPRQTDVVQALRDALATPHIAAALQHLLPPYPHYARLRHALAQYRTIATQGGWPTIPAGPTLHPGNQGPRVQRLRTRLAATGDLRKVHPHNPAHFDPALEHAVRTFQARHGLHTDGVVGTATLLALNVPVATRIRQIEVNMERWRWLPHTLGPRYILVNSAAFTLEVVEEDQIVLTMRVVVGKPYQRTPVFSAPMTYLVLNPSWHVPPSIAVTESLPLIQNDPGYLAQQGIRVYQNWGAGAREVDPHEVAWSQVSGDHFPYRLQQLPGPKNPLGRVKFMFPNPFQVYLHDTPAPQLFTHPVRTFSHGCIRIEKPLELARYLLRGDATWGPDAMAAVLTRGTEQTVPLPQPIPVHLLYWTAWIDRHDRLQFRQDIYNRDEALIQALQEATPSSQTSRH